MKSLSRPQAKEEVVAELDLRGCPEGEALNEHAPSPNVDRFFEGWDNPLTPHKSWRRQSFLRVILDQGQPVLEYYLSRRHEHPEHRSWIGSCAPRCLRTGEDFWRDYTLQSEIRIMNEQTEPNCDNELVLPWAGLMFRYQDLRHYYFFCLQNPAAEEKKIVLYRRADNDWHILAEEPFQVDTTKYYSLKAKLQGNRIYCYLDGSELFRATDYLYTQGKAGVRFNTDSRVKSINITMTKGEQHIFQSAKNKHEEEVDAIREEYPKPVLWKKLDFSHLWPFGCRFVNLRSAEFKDLLLLGREQLVAADLEGEVLWQKEGRISIHNIISRPDGKVEIPALSGKEIIIFDGANGQTLKAAPAPSTGKPRRRPSFDIKTVNLSDTSWSIILKLGAGKDLWAYDEDLKLIWTTSVKPDYGHSNSVIFYDVDGDGSKEILAGSTLLSPAGETIWQVEGYEEILNYKSRGCAWHVDSCVMGDFADDEEVDPVAFLSASSCGVWVVDALTGKVRNIHYVGHAQGTSVGNFRPDTAGLEVLVGTRWGNYGILNLFSGRGERLLTFEPDNISQGGPPANWTGDGRDLILLATSPQALGLWDGWGRKVVTFPVEDLPEKTTDYYRNWAGCLNLYGDSRDEVIFCAQGKIHIFTPE